MNERYVFPSPGTPFVTALHGAILAPASRLQAATFRLTRTLSDVLVQALVFALPFIPVTYAYILLQVNVIDPVAPITMGQAAGALLLAPFAVPFVVVPFIPVAWFRLGRIYGRTSPFVLWYGAVFGVAFWLVFHLLTALAEPAAPTIVFLAAGLAGVAVSEVVLRATSGPVA